MSTQNFVIFLIFGILGAWGAFERFVSTAVWIWGNRQPALSFVGHVRLRARDAARSNLFRLVVEMATQALAAAVVVISLTGIAIQPPLSFGILVPATAAMIVGLLLLGYINNIFSVADWVSRLLGRVREPPTQKEIDQIQRSLDEVREKLASLDTAGDVGTEELAKAAGPDTAERLKEAIQLQAEHKDQEAIDTLYEAFRRDLPPEAKAQLHNLLGNSFLRLSELEEAEGHYRQALDASRAAKIRKYEPTTLGNLGIVYAQQGDYERAEEHLQQSLNIERDIGNRLGEAADLANLGNIYLLQDALARAEEHYQQAFAIDREVGNRLGEAATLGSLGSVYLQQGDLEQAEEHLQQSLKIQRELGDRIGEANQLGNLGLVYADTGDLKRAEEHHRQALAIQREIGNRLDEAVDLGNLGLLAARRDQRDEACRLLKEAAAIYDEIGAGGPGPDTVRAKLEELGCE